MRETYDVARVAKLASNENRWGCSPRAVEAAAASLADTSLYPDPDARDLRRALAARFAVRTENVIAGSGSEGLMSQITRAFFLDDEEALCAAVTFMGFPILAKSRGVKLVAVPLTADWRIDLDALADAVTPKTKIIYLANPNNPTGTVFTRAEFERFMARIPDHVLVILDEAYFEFAQDLPDFPDSMRYRLDNVITLRTFSKAYGLAGLRIGYGFAHDRLISELFKVKLPFEPSAPAQAAALAALEDEAFLDMTRRKTAAGRERLYRLYDALGFPYVVSHANAVMSVLPTEKEAVELTQYLLEDGVIVRRLPAFGLPNAIRVTVGTDEDLDQYEARLRSWAR